jgi:hypothetical protein
MPVISISIDLTRSTEIKQQIAHIARNNSNHAQELMEDYARKIAWAESRFFHAVEASGIGVENIFLMKNIGDEMWFTIPFDNISDAKNKVSNLLGQMKYYSQEVDSAFISGDPRLYDNKLHFETYDHTEHKHIYFQKKIFIDILNNYFDINSIRYDYHLKTIAEIYEIRRIKSQENLRVNAFEEDYQNTFAKLTGNLNLGITIIEEKKTKNHLRTDFIGPDVDKFFRCTKFTHPSFTVIGQTLFEFVFEKTDIENRYSISQKHGVHQINHKAFTCLREHHSEKTMKGIVGDYDTYLVLQNPLLFHKVDKNPDTKKVRKLFADNNLHKYFRYRKK